MFCSGMKTVSIIIGEKTQYNSDNQTLVFGDSVRVGATPLLPFTEKQEVGRERRQKAAIPCFSSKSVRIWRLPASEQSRETRS